MTRPHEENAIQPNTKKTAKGQKYEYPWYIMGSYGTRELYTQWISAAFGFTVFFYYETVIGLDVKLAAAAYIIYQIWNSVNDPMTGFLMERVRFPWERKRGYKRMPFIIGGGLLWLLSYLAIFLGPTENPDANKWAIFGWYVVSLCLYDVFGTIFDVNAVSLFPEKFKGLDERRTVQSVGTIFGIVGLVLAATIPPLFLTTGVAATYRKSAVVTVLVGVFFFLFMLPGIYETQQVRALHRNRSQAVESGEQSPGFFSTLKIAFSNRRFVGKIVLFFGYQVGVVMLQTSALYIVTYLLDAAPSTISLILGSMLGGALVSMPVWTVLSKKANNNRLISLLGGFLLVLSFLPMIFVQTLIGWIVSIFFFGIALGSQWFMDPPTMADVIDDAAVRTGRRDTSVYISLQSLFFKLGQVSIAAVIAVVHSMTGFVSGASDLQQLIAQSPTPELALFGIRIHSAIVPAVIALITTLLFWKLYDLTPEKVAENKRKLGESGI